jgi:hypothetical protein
VRHATTGDSPCYMVTGEMPRLTNLNVFGCRAYVLILPTPSKFERRAEPGVLLECLAYGVHKVLVPSKDGGESKIIISRHVTFDEEELPGHKDMEDIMDGDGASDSCYACRSIESSDPGFDSDYSESESDYLMLLRRSILHIRIILVMAALQNWLSQLVKIEMARRLTQTPKWVLP